MNKEDESPYCEVCGTCGYIGCCGIRNFIEEHIKGKTNCKNEDLIISELICLCEYEEEKDKKIERLNNIINKKEQFLGDNIKRLEREVVKRDNIINELEKWSEEYRFANIFKNKLQELKGSNK